MMSKRNNLAIDTLRYVNILEEGGINRKTAETHARAVAAVMTENLATKQDLDVLRYELRSDIDHVYNKLDKKIDTEIAGVKTEMRDISNRLGNVESDGQTLKGDMQTLKGDVQTLKGDMQTLKGDVQIMQGDISLIRADMRLMKKDLIFAMGGIVTAGFTLMSAVMTTLHFVF